jgi:hypothetical protein
MGSKSDTFSPRRRASPTESMQPICFAETEQTDNSQHNERGCTLAPQVQCYSWDLNTSTVNGLVYKRKFVLINIRLSCECSLHPILRPGLSLKRFEGYLDSLSLSPPLSLYWYIYIYILWAADNATNVKLWEIMNMIGMCKYVYDVYIYMCIHVGIPCDCSQQGMTISIKNWPLLIGWFIIIGLYT